MVGVSCGQSRVDRTLSLAQRRVGTGLEREKGFEPSTTCLEGRYSTSLSYSRSTVHILTSRPCAVKRG